MVSAQFSYRALGGVVSRGLRSRDAQPLRDEIAAANGCGVVMTPED